MTSVVAHAADRRHAPWLFLFATLAWTWTFWIVAAFVSPGGMPNGGAGLRGLPLLLYAVGGLGPVTVASLFVAAGRADESLPMFWRRAVDPRLLRPRAWLAVLLLAVLPPFALWIAAWAFRNGAPAPGGTAYLLIGIVAGLLEEPGWRGYAQEGLQRRLPVVGAALVVGIFWAAWHLPLFWIAGTWQHGQGIGTWAFWMFLLGVVALGPIYAWLYNFAGRVILAAVLLHAIGNSASEVFAVPDAERLEVGVYVALAVLLTAFGWRWMHRPTRS